MADPHESKCSERFRTENYASQHCVPWYEPHDTRFVFLIPYGVVDSGFNNSQNED